RETEHILRVQSVVVGGPGRVPVAAHFDGLSRVGAEKLGWIRMISCAADVLESPGEWADQSIVVGFPTTRLISMDAACEPVHAEKLPVDSLQSTTRKKKSDPRQDVRGGECQMRNAAKSSSRSARTREPLSHKAGNRVRGI